MLPLRHSNHVSSLAPRTPTPKQLHPKHKTPAGMCPAAWMVGAVPHTPDARQTNPTPQTAPPAHAAENTAVGFVVGFRGLF